jgi:hypothetical protein
MGGLFQNISFANGNINAMYSGIDADAQLFITATGISGTNANAINQLVVDLKAANIWTKMKALYPMVGGTATTCKWNLKNPLDTNAAFRLLLTGGFTASSTGVLFNGSNGYAETYLAPSTSLLQNNAHVSFYSRTNIGGEYIDIGSSGDPSSGIHGSYVISRYTDNLFYGRINTTTNTVVANLDSRGFYISSRLSGTTQVIYKNSTPTSGASNSTGLTGNTINIGRWNNPGGAFYYSPRECAFASIGDGLSNAEALAFYTAVQAFNTTLGRQV